MLSKATQRGAARRGSLVALAAVGALLGGGASSAVAATITQGADPGDYSFMADAGATNDLTINQSGVSNLTFTSTGDLFTAVSIDCEIDALDAAVATCTTPGGAPVNSIVVELLDGDDQTTLTGVTAAVFQIGGEGNDILRASNLAEGFTLMDGGDAAGNDAFVGGPGSEIVDY